MANEVITNKDILELNNQLSVVSSKVSIVNKDTTVSIGKIDELLDGKLNNNEVYLKSEIEDKYIVIDNEADRVDGKIKVLEDIVDEGIEEPFLTIDDTDTVANANPHREVPKNGDIHINSTSGLTKKYVVDQWVNQMKITTSGGTTTEVDDARTDLASGVTYASLGERMDTNFSALNLEIDNSKLVQYSGEDMLINESIEGYGSDIQIKGKTVQTLITHNTPFYRNSKKYGVRMDKATGTAAMTRLGDAIGKVANVSIDDGDVVNDFNNIYPWSDRRLCNMDENGNITAYEGEATFKVDGSNGDVMVETPRFYTKYVETDNEVEYWISPEPTPGYRLSSCFIGSNGELLDACYSGAYMASTSTDGNKLLSISGQYAAEISRTNARTKARSKSVTKSLNWGITPMAYRCDILNYLFYIEFANLDSQVIMMGQVNFGKKLCSVAETNVNRFIVTNSDAVQYVIGMTVIINNIKREVLSVSNYDTDNKSFVVDGAPFTTTLTTEIDMRPWKCGSCNKVKKSGSIVSNASGRQPMKYRGEENIYGNMGQWVDGININDYQSWVCDDYSKFGDDIFVKPYNKLGYVNYNGEGYSKSMGYDVKYPSFNLPTVLGANHATYYSDYYYGKNSGKRGVFVGGYLGNGRSAGLVYWHCNHSWTNVGWTLGARLFHKKG